jgi:uroporphyrinogen-III synthase
MLPAPGQGAIAVETRASDVRTNEMVGRLNDPATMAAVTVERTVLARIGGGCEVPLGILANASADGLHVDASMTGADGKCFRYSYDGSASDPTEAGLRITEEILMSDAREIVGMGSPSSGLCGKVVMVTREEEPWGGLYEMLMQKGAVPVYFPTIQIRAPDRIPELESAMERIDTYDIVAVASRRGAEALARAAGNEAGRATGRARVVAVGDETKKALEAHGISVTYVPREAAAETLAEGITDVDSRRVLAIGSDRSDWAIAEILGRRGAIVDRITAYTVGVPKVSQARIAEVLGYKYDFVTFASPSAAHGLRETLGDKMGALMAASRAVCIGETTASACTRLGIGVAGIAERHGLAGMLEAMEKLSREG